MGGQGSPSERRRGLQVVGEEGRECEQRKVEAEEWGEDVCRGIKERGGEPVDRSGQSFLPLPSSPPPELRHCFCPSWLVKKGDGRGGCL